MQSKLIFSFLLFLLPACYVFGQTEQFKLEANQFGLLEQTLLNHAIENDPEIKELDKKLNKVGLVRDIGNIGSSSIKSSIRILNLSHYGADNSARFVTNGLNLGSDVLNIATAGYRIHKTKKIKEQVENRISLIKSELSKIISVLTTSVDNIEARDKLINLVGEKSANDYLSWLKVNTK